VFPEPPPDWLLEPLPLPEPDELDDDIDDPLDLLPDDEPLLLEEPLPEPDPLPLELDPDPEEWAVAGMSLWTHTPSAEKVFVPGMWIATVRVGASMRSTVSTSSSARRSPIRKSPFLRNSADEKPHSSPRRMRNGCSGVALIRRLMTTKPVCSPSLTLATRPTVGIVPRMPWCESHWYCAR